MQHYGKMKQGVKLLGTSLALRKGELVKLLPARNLPQGGYFARPANGKWSDGIAHSSDDSIHVTRKDFAPIFGEGKPYYWITDGGIFCGDCLKANPEDYLAKLSGDWQKCLSFDIPLDKYGYTLYDNEYEAGQHPGQNADPEKIAKELREKGIADFIFVLDGQGQFDCSFSVWIKQQGTSNEKDRITASGYLV